MQLEMEYILFSKKVWVEVNILIKVQIIQKSKIYKKVFFQKVCEMFRIFFKKMCLFDSIPANNVSL